MPQSLSNFDNALKENYAPGLRNAVNDKATVVWAEAVKNEDDIIGEEAVWSIHSGRSNSTGARAELATLPTADRQRHLKARRPLTYQYHTIKVSGPAKHLTRGDSGAFARALEVEIKGAEKDLKNDMARQAFGQALTDGSTLQTGVIGTLSADPGTGTTLTFANEDESVIRHFQVGMLLEVVNPSGGAVRGTAGPYEVSSVSKSARTVTIASAADTAIASGDYVVRASSDGGTSFGDEIDGLRYLISASGTYAGIDPSTNPVWAANTAGSTTTGVSEVLFEEAAEVVETDGDGNTPELFVVEHVQRRKLASLLQAQKRYDGRDVTLQSGWKGLSLARGTLVADRYCPTTYGFGIYQPELQKFVGLDFQWDEDDGEVFYKALDGSDAVEARFKGYVQLAATTRNSHVVIRLSAPSF
jgi:hypothetical protein